MTTPSSKMITSPKTKLDGVSNPRLLLKRVTEVGHIAKIMKAKAVRNQTTAYFSLSTDLRIKSKTKTRIPIARITKSNLFVPMIYSPALDFVGR
jgi:hypothetical protein